MRHPKADADAQHVFREKIERYKADGRPIVYIDESGFAHDMPRTHGYGQRVSAVLASMTGTRAVGSM